MTDISKIVSGDHPLKGHQNTHTASIAAFSIVPLAGVIFLHWNVGEILFLYWYENIINGLFYVAKMAISSKQLEMPSKDEMTNAPEFLKNPKSMESFNLAIKLFLIPFFFVHYGGFVAGHGMFLMIFFGKQLGIPGAANDPTLANFIYMLRQPWTLQALGLLAIGQFMSFYYQFIKTNEYKNKHASELMFEPYQRIIILHVIIICCGFVVVLLAKLNFLASIAIIIIKTAVEITFNKKYWEKQLAAPS